MTARTTAPRATAHGAGAAARSKPAANTLGAIAAEITDFLLRATADGLSTDEMRTELNVVQSRRRRRRPGLRLTLVAHIEPYDGSLAHDVVVRDGTDVVVIGTAGAPGLPWPLRGVTRADEQRLLRVNGAKLDVPEALACLDVLFDDRHTLRTLVDSCLVAEALAEEPVTFTAPEVQEAADAFRRGKGLLTAAQTSAWLAERAMSESEFEDVVRRTAAVVALRRRVAAVDRVARHFAAHRQRYATVLVAWAQGTRDGLANDALGAVAEARRRGAPAGLTEWLVGELPDGMAALADAAVGVPLPVRVDGTPGTAVVVDRRDPVLDSSTAEQIERELFESWLAGRRRTADIEWHWGDAHRTGRAR
jgi:putative peptide maturation system protein